MRSVLIERKRLSSAGIDLRTTTFDLGVPRRTRVCVGLTIEAPEELERQARSFFGGKPKNFGQDIRSGHDHIIADGAGSEAPRDSEPETGSDRTESRREHLAYVFFVHEDKLWSR